MSIENIKDMDFTGEEIDELIKFFIEKKCKVNKDSNFFNPKENERYYFINSNGCIDSCKWSDDNYEHICQKENYNISTSLEYMKKLYLQGILYRSLKQFSWEHEGNNINYKDKKMKYYINFDLKVKQYEIYDAVYFLDFFLYTLLQKK